MFFIVIAKKHFGCSSILIDKVVINITITIKRKV